MTYDEQRKRIYELECALGKSIGLSETLVENLRKSEENNNKLRNSMTEFVEGMRAYIYTMDKKLFMSVIDKAAVILKAGTTKEQQQTEQPEH